MNIDLRFPRIQDSLGIYPHKVDTITQVVNGYFQEYDTLPKVLNAIETNTCFNGADRVFALFLMGYMYRNILATQDMRKAETEAKERKNKVDGK